MKSWLIAVLIAALPLALAPSLAEAKRFGGGSSFGMQRSAPPPQRAPEAPRPAQPPASNPGQPANAAAPAAGAAGAAATGARSWLGPVAGLAAGLGLVALMSHLGLGEELASFMMLALLAMAAIFVVRLLMRRAGAGGAAQPAVAAAAGRQAAPWAQREAMAPTAAGGVSGSSAGGQHAAAAPLAIGSALRPRLAVPGVDAGERGSARAALPADFDAEGFERIARAIFVRMQAAYDAGDLDDLRQFTTPEVFAELRVQLHERGGAAQHTDVAEVHAEVVEVAEEGPMQIVSVRYHGRVVEEQGAEAVPFDEMWHLVRPLNGGRGWAIAGVQQLEPA